MFSGYNKYNVISHTEKKISGKKPSQTNSPDFLSGIPQHILEIIFSFLEINQLLEARVLSKQVKLDVDSFKYKRIAIHLAKNQEFWVENIKKDFSKIHQEDFKKFILANQKLLQCIKYTNSITSFSGMTIEKYEEYFKKILESGYDGLAYIALFKAKKNFLSNYGIHWQAHSSSIWHEEGGPQLNSQFLSKLLTSARQSNNATLLQHLITYLKKLGQAYKLEDSMNALLNLENSEKVEVGSSIKFTK